MTEGEDEWLRRQDWLNLDAPDRQRVGRFERGVRVWVLWVPLVVLVVLVAAVVVGS